MIQICVVYKYKGKNGAVGDGRTFYGCRHLPLSVEDILKIERQLCEREGSSVSLSAILSNLRTMAPEVSRMINFLAGLLVGGAVGLVVTALCVATAREDEEDA